MSTTALPFMYRENPGQPAKLSEELIVDSFAGGGGASLGIEAALGRCVDVAINHDRLAIEVHERNHPNTRHCCEDIWTTSPRNVTGGRPVGLLWASPDCTHFSKAKGGKPVKNEIRGLAWVLIRWAREAKPRVIILENVEEFQTWGPVDENGHVIKHRKGEEFEQWVRALRRLGYRVQWDVLNAADYGAPTARYRLFVIARRDNSPIVWPEPTHGPGRKPYRTAAECIDWSLPCHSIFLTPDEAREVGVRRPLAENTMKRIARGVWKFVINAKEPFIVTCNHAGDHFRGQSLRQPMKTLTANRDAHGLVVPYVSAIDNKSSKDRPVYPVGAPLKTITQENRFALVSVFLAKHYTGVDGQKMEKPVGTITAIDHHSVVTTHLTKLYGTCRHGQDMREPMPTITGGGQHIAEVRAFLIKYYGCGTGQTLDKPIGTVTSKETFGLVAVNGQDYQITDIGLRMLQPHELLRAQFGEYAGDYRLVGSKSRQVAMIGNSVPPAVARAVVEANMKGGE